MNRELFDGTRCACATRSMLPRLAYVADMMKIWSDCSSSDSCVTPGVTDLNLLENSFHRARGLQRCRWKRVCMRATSRPLNTALPESPRYFRWEKSSGTPHTYCFTCSSLHSQNLAACAVPPSASVFCASIRSLRKGPNRPHGMTITRYYQRKFSISDEIRLTPSTGLLFRDIGRETGEQLGIGAIDGLVKQSALS